MKTFIDFIYTLLIGAAVALFVGLGIWTFYSGPKSPDYPEYPTSSINEDPAADKEYQIKEKNYEKQLDDYEKQQKSYYKKVAAISLAASIVFFAAGLVFIKRANVIGEGLALGGIFTGVYTAIIGSLADFKQLVFAAITAILIMLILLVLYRTQMHQHIKTNI